MPQGWSIRAQLLVLALVAMAPLAAIIAYGISESGADAMASAERETMRIATRSAADLEGFIRETERSLAALAARPLIRALDPEKCDPILRDVRVVFPKLEFPEVNSIGIRDKQGNRVCSIVPDPAPAAVVRQSPAFQRAIERGAFDLSDGFVSPLTRRWIAMSQMPLRDSANELAGLLFLRLDLRNLQDRVLAAPPSGAVVGVFDREGRYLMRWPDPEAWVGRTVNNEEIVRRHARTRYTGFERLRGTDGIERIYAFHPVGDTGWIVASGVTADAVLAPYRKKILQGAGLGLLALLLAVALALRAGAAIARPIRALETTAMKIAAGDIGARALPEGPPEVATVARAINRMLDARAQSEAATLEAQSRYRGIVDSAMDGIITIDEAQVIVQFNAAAEAMFGLSAAQAIGQPIDRLIPERFRVVHATHVRSFGKDGVTRRKLGSFGTLPALRADGSEFPIQASISRSVSGGHITFTVILRDISSRLETEKRARRQADFYAALSQTSQAIVRMHDPETLYEEICRICVDYGHATMAFIALIEAGHAVPKAWAGPVEGYLPGIDIPLDSDGPQSQGPIATAVREGRPYVSNDIYADPKTIPWRERAARIGSLATAALPFRRAGRIAGVLSLHVSEKDYFSGELIGLLAEITDDLAFGLDNYDRDLARAESLRLERLASERFETIFEATPLATCVVRRADGIFLAANEAYCRNFAYSREQLMGHTAAEIGLWADPEARQDCLDRLQPTGQVRDFAARIRNGNGEILNCLVSAALIEFSGEPCILFLNMDVTERKRAEDQVRELNATLELRVAERTQELEAANRELDSFGRTIAHDLRAPLRSISRFSEALREPLAGNAAGTGYLKRIARNVARMDDMLTDLLNFARSGRATISVVPIDMTALAAAVFDDFATNASPRPDFALDALPAAAGDASLMRQVWANLLSNAIKYSSKTERPRIEVGARAGTGEVEYYVRDNGCGFDPAYAGKLFVVFQRLHGETEYEGNGIGLAIVHRIVERHGGRVSAHSAPGKGAEFCFTLPLRPRT